MLERSGASSETEAEFAETEMSEISGEVRKTQRELGSERADTLSWTTSEKAQKGSTQSSGCAEGWGLLSLFLNPRILWFLCLWLGWLRLWL